MQSFIAFLIKRAYLIIIGLVIISGIYFTYQWSRRPFDAWNLIPSNPVLILESSDFTSLYNDLESKAFWGNLKNIPYFGQISERLQYMSLVLSEEGGFQRFFKDKKMLASIHLTSHEEFDALFFVPLGGQIDQDYYQKLLGLFQEHPSYQITSRIFRGVQILVISHQESETAFSFIIHKDYFIGSYTPLLLEDVIRKVSNGEPAFAFAGQKRLDKIHQSPAFQFKALSIYLNNAQIQRFLRLFIQDQHQPYFTSLPGLADHIFLHLDEQPEGLHLSGFSHISKQQKNSFLKVFEGQKNLWF